MHTKIISAGIHGMETYPVEVEIDVSYGLSRFEIVGLPENSVKEGRTRIDSAMKNCGYSGNRNRIRVNLSPAAIRKQGALYDLPIAVGILASRGIIRTNSFSRYMMVGELSLDGKIRPIRGAILIALKSMDMGLDGLILPYDNAPEMDEIRDLKAYGIKSLMEVVDFLNGDLDIDPKSPLQAKAIKKKCGVDFNEVKGQEAAKRALSVAVAGGHNILMIGPPGSGKSMIARRIPTVMPLMSYDEIIQTTKIYSLLGKLPRRSGLIKTRPFRSPHHTISEAGMAGGNRLTYPGELSLANNGVLFLDEFTEFRKNVLEVMRQPLEDGCVTISRIGGSFTYPCNFILVAAMNPCPCGYLTDNEKPCRCSAQVLERYMRKISSPILDRIDIQIEVPRVNVSSLSAKNAGTCSKEIREAIEGVMMIQKRRLGGHGLVHNAQMGPSHLEIYCSLKEEPRGILESAVKKFNLSARSYTRILKVARTIADFEKSGGIETHHIAEAIHYRVVERIERFY